MSDDDLPIHQAARNGDVAELQNLVAAGSSVNLEKDNGMTPLYLACQEGHVEAAQFLMQEGANLNKADVRGWTPLQSACGRGHAEAVKLLLQGGADLNKAAQNGFTPLHLACAKGRVEIAKQLVQGGADLNKAEQSGLTPLHVACFYGHVDVAEQLLQGGADPRVKNLDGHTARDLVNRGELGTLLEGAEKDWSRTFVLQVSAQGTELTFRQIGGEVVASLTWPEERPVTELAPAVRAAMRRSGFEFPWPCEWKFVLPLGAPLNTEPCAGSLFAQLASS